MEIKWIPARIVVLMYISYAVAAQETTVNEDLTTEDTQANIPPRFNLNLNHGLGMDMGAWEMYLRSEKFRKWATTVLLPLGLVCNGLSLVVFLQKHRRSQTVSMVLTALAVADIFSFTLEWSLFIGTYTNFTLHYHGALCDIVTYVTYVGRTCSSWYILLFTTERFISVKFPLKKASLVTKPRMRLALFLITLLCFISQAYFIEMYHSVKSLAGSFCLLKSEHRNIFEDVKFIVRECFGFLLPAAITAVFNVWIIILLRSWAKKQSDLKGENKDKGGRDADITALTVMLVMVSTFSVVVYTPRSISQVYFGIRDEYSINGITVDNCLIPIGLLNHSVNFFFYCIGGKTFRQDFVRIITCGKGLGFFSSICL